MGDVKVNDFKRVNKTRELFIVDRDGDSLKLFDAQECDTEAGEERVYLCAQTFNGRVVFLTRKSLEAIRDAIDGVII